MSIEKQNINKLPKILKRDEIHVYSVDFTSVIECLDDFDKILSDEEKNRAARFHFEKDRNNFVLSRGILKSILAHYLQKKPQDIIFQFNDYGKPFLTEVDEMEFNISHSKDKLLLAFSRNISLGIDIEFMNDDFAKGDIAEKFFSPVEVSILNELPNDLKVEGFYNCWTRKEALIKGIGKGLSIPLDSFDVELIPGRIPRIFDMRFDNMEKGKWEIINLDLYKDYKSAVALRGKNYDIKIFYINECGFLLTYT